MNIALISDIHDNENQLLCALHAAEQARCSQLICLGDLQSIASLHTLRLNWEGELHFVRGNNDWQHQEMSRLARIWSQTTYYGEGGSLNINGKKIFITHYPMLAEAAAQEGRYDAVFYGHTHKAEQHLCGTCLVANPGELQGRTKHCSWAIYNTQTHHLRHLEL